MKYNIITNNATSEITEKKSKFIGNIFYIESREEAEKIIKDTNKKYHDARHNCYAYRIIENDTIIEKTSDDGEPSGTAGGPMLTYLSKNNIINVLVIVTRYFGGILLGTGGLVRAYSKACIEAFEKAELKEIEKGYLYKIYLDYKEIEKFKYFCNINNIVVNKESYLENIELEIKVKENIVKILENYKNINFKIQKLEKIKEIYI